MRKRPLSLKLVALFYLLIGPGLILQIAFLFGHDLSEWGLTLSKMTPINWLLAALTLTTSLSIWNGNRMVKYLIPINILTVTVNNWAVSSYGQYYSETATLIASLLFILFNCILLFGKGLEAIIHPSKQWWRASARVRTNEQIFLGLDGGAILQGALFDISQSGLFIGQELDLWGQMLHLGDEVSVGLKRGEKEPLILKAKIVRRDLARGHYPSGFGLSFLQLGLLKRCQLSLLVRQLST